MTVFSIIHNAMGNVSDKIVKISRVGLAWLAFLTLSPLLLLIFGSLLLWKYVILWVIVKLFKRKFLQGFANAEAVFAIDRFWENSRSSLGLIVEIDGNVNIDNFRDEFKKKVLDYAPTKYPIPHMEESSSSSSIPSSCNKPFAKLAQIPVTFCGYYFWQKANYFLIHEHIRQINQPTDEIGLKKAVGTLMTLPFPNRRPLWEILVYSNYLGTTTVGRGTTCGSALFIRIHRSVADSQGLMNLLRHMISSTGTVAPIIDSVKSIQHLQTSSMKSENSVTATTMSINTVQIATSAFSRHISEKCTSLVFFPLRAFQFARKIINVPDGIAKSNVESEGQGEEGQGQGHSHLDSANASWTLLQDALVHKISLNQSPLLIGRSAVEMSLFLEGLTSRSRHKCLNVPEEKGQAESPHQGKCKTRVLVPVIPQGETSPYYSDELILTNDRSFVTIESPCVSSSENLPSSNSNKTAILKSIQTQLHHHYQPQFGENDDRDHNQIVRLYLALLSLLPRHLLRYLLLANKWGAGCFIFEQFQIHLDKPAGDKPEELKLFGQYPVSQIVPLVGLQWTHTLASAATLRWRDGEIVMSLIANASILGPLSQGNPQDHVERIVRGFPEDVEKLAEDAEDHGFVSIPIS